MNLRWLLGNFADPQYDLDRKEQFRLSNEATEHFFPKRGFAVWTIASVAAALAAMKYLPKLNPIDFGSANLEFVVCTAVVILVFWIWIAWIYNRVYQRSMRQAMRRNGHDVCIECGYLTTGLAKRSTKCPECGAELPAIEERGAS